MAHRLAAAAATTALAAFALTATAPQGPATAETPVPGGTLNVLGSSDTDYLDPNISYYPIGFSYLRQFSRQLYSYPAIDGQTDQALPDLATDLPTISPDGLTYTISIRPGAKWNTSPPRQVTAADVVRGVKTTCNPFQPYGGLFNYDSLIVGMRDFCSGFAKANLTARAMKRYVRNHDLPGVRVGADPLTVVFTLTHPTSYFTDLLAIPAFSPRPHEMMDYAPASAQASQHTVSDGPYEVSSYQPTKKLVFVRNGAWDASTDPLRAAYVDRIVITMTNDYEAAQQQLETNVQSADVYLGAMPDDDAVDREAAGDPNLTLAPSFMTNPFVVFNTRSPNNDNALRHKKVRRALFYALDRNALVNALPGGHTLNEPLSHVLPSGIVGSEDFDLYPHDVAKAKALLADAGAADLTLKVLFRPSSPTLTALSATIRDQLGEAGVTVKRIPATDADYYTKYLQNPSSARHGIWDISFSGWFPDWYHDAAWSYLHPLYTGTPPETDNFGLLDDPQVESLINQAATAGDNQTAAGLWHQADQRVMRDAATFPLAEKLAATYHASQVHNFVYLPAIWTGDFSNMWLDPAANGG